MKNLPHIIPVFPLEGVVMFPNTYLPLNIFEPRYLKMIEHSMSQESRLIGMIQPKNLMIKIEMLICMMWAVLEELLSLRKQKTLDTL